MPLQTCTISSEKLQRNKMFVGIESMRWDYRLRYRDEITQKEHHNRSRVLRGEKALKGDGSLKISSNPGTDAANETKRITWR